MNKAGFWFDSRSPITDDRRETVKSQNQKNDSNKMHKMFVTVPGSNSFKDDFSFSLISNSISRLNSWFLNIEAAKTRLHLNSLSAHFAHNVLQMLSPSPNTVRKIQGYGELT